MKIGELAKRTGVSIRMLRYYEAEGLLSPARTAANYRDYDPDAVRVIERIRLLAGAGMPLATIRIFLPCIRGDRPVLEPCDELRVSLHDQLRKIDADTAALAARRALVEGFIAEIDAR